VLASAAMNRRAPLPLIGRIPYGSCSMIDLRAAENWASLRAPARCSPSTLFNASSLSGERVGRPQLGQTRGMTPSRGRILNMHLRHGVTSAAWLSMTARGY
jgi:hypothetical protein